MIVKKFFADFCREPPFVEIFNDKDTNICKEQENMILLKLQEVNDRLAFFENCINYFGYMPFEGELQQIAKKIKRCVTVNDKQYWIRANTEQEYADKLIHLLMTGSALPKSIFKDYAIKWFEVYSKPNIEIVTATTYACQLKKCNLYTGALYV